MDVALEIINYFSEYPWLAVLILFCCNLVFIPVMEEFTLMVGGFLAAKHPELIPVTMACGWFGMVFTDYWDFLLARWFGQKLFGTKVGRLLISPEKLSQAMAKVDKYGPRIVFGVRFVPGGIRVPTFMACGLSNVTHKSFLLNSGLGAIIVMQVSFWVGYSLGDNIEQLQQLATKVDSVGKIVIIVVVIVAVAGFFVMRHLKGKKE